MKIRVCIPFYSEFEDTKSGCRELKDWKEHEFHIERRQGTYIGEIRNSLISDNQDRVLEYDAFLFVDSDISFTKFHVQKLIEYDLPIVSLPYRTHKNPDLYQAGFFRQDYPGLVLQQIHNFQKGLQSIDFIGAGFVLIKREVFLNIKPDWFRNLSVELPNRIVSIGEDYSFCILAKQAGYDIWCDFDHEVKHRLRTRNSFSWGST